MSKEELTTKEHHHQGSVNAEDQEFANWLNRLWARKEPPERVELWQTQGRVRGEMIFHEDFHPGEKIDPEKINKLSNEIIEAAQNDCDSREKPKARTYQVAIIDRNRKAVPLIRVIGPIQPGRGYAKSEGNNDDDDESLDAKKLDMRYVQIGMEQSRWDKQRYDQVLGELLILYHHTVQDLRVWNEKLMLQNMQSHERMQELQDRGLDRELVRDKERFKMSMWEDGKRTIMNLLPGLVANNTPALAAAIPQPQTQAPGTELAKTQYGSSPERALVDNFLHDCDKADISMALFGAFEELGGHIVMVKPGIFTAGQYRVLLGVRDGSQPPASLDVLMPKSGHENEITMEQINQAQAAGVTEGMSLALFELVAMRNKAKEAQSPPPQAQPENSQETRP